MVTKLPSYVYWIKQKFTLCDLGPVLRNTYLHAHVCEGKGCEPPVRLRSYSYNKHRGLHFTVIIYLNL